MLPNKNHHSSCATPSEVVDLLSHLGPIVSIVVACDQRLRLLPEVDQRDVVQMACARFLGRVENVGVESAEHWKALLRLTVSSVITDLLRKKQHRRERVQLGGLSEVLSQEALSEHGLRFVGTSSGYSRDAVACAIARENVHELAKALRELGERDRKTFLRAVMKDESIAEISARYGVSERSIRRHLASAHQRLHQSLSEQRVIPKPVLSD